MTMELGSGISGRDTITQTNENGNALLLFAHFEENDNDHCYLLTCLPGSHRKGSWPLDLPRACSQRSAGDHELNAVLKGISSIFIAILFGCKTLIEFCWWSTPITSLMRKKHRPREVDRGCCQF